MRKQRLLTVVVLASALCAAVAPVHSVQSRLEKFANTKHHCSLYYSPEAWIFQLQTSPQSDLAVFAAKDDPETVAVLNMFNPVAGLKMKPKQFYETDKESLTNIFGGLDVLEEKTLNLGGADAHMVTFDGKDKRVTRYTIVSQGYVYLLGYISPKKNYERLLDNFKMLVNTFAIDGLGTGSAPLGLTPPDAGPLPAGGNALTVSTRPSKIFVDIRGDDATWLYHLTVKNPNDGEVEITQVQVKYASGEKTVEEVKLDAEMLKQLTKEKSNRIAAKGQLDLPDNAEHRKADAKIDGLEYQIVFRLGERAYHQTYKIPLVTFQQKSRLMLPFNGIWRVAQGHDVLESHRQSADGQSFAYDFIFEVNGQDRVDPREAAARARRLRRARPAARKPGKLLAEDFYAFGRKVLAPAAGKIVRAVKAEPDRAPTLTRLPLTSPPKSNPYKILGNYLVIDHGNGEFSLLAHLKKDSLQVKVGDVVKQGQFVAECGNSGNSTQPHLHYQLMDGPDHFASHGLPSKFSNYRVWMEHQLTSVTLGSPAVKERVEKVVERPVPAPKKKVVRRKPTKRAVPTQKKSGR